MVRTLKDWYYVIMQLRRRRRMKKIIIILSAVFVLGITVICPILADELSPRRGPYYQNMYVLNSCASPNSHFADVGGFGTMARLDLSKTYLSPIYEDGKTPAYVYVYVDVDGREYVPYYEGYDYSHSVTYNNGSCWLLH